MPLEVVTAQYEDLSELLDVHWIAYQNPYEPYVDLVVPGFNDDTPPGRATALAKCKVEWLSRWKGNPREIWLKVVDTDINKIIAGTKLTVFETNVYGENVARPVAQWLPTGSKVRQYAEFTMQKRIERYIKECQMPHILINIFYTHPEHRGQGAGSMMLEWVSDKADELGYQTFVEASKMGEPVYSKAGFLPIGTFCVPRIDTDDFEMIAIQNKWPFQSLFMRRPSNTSPQLPKE